MSTRGFPWRFKQLAFWLSLLALLSALWAPAAVLAQDLRQGLTGLCSGGIPSSQDGHADDKAAAHCELCALPGLALPPAPTACLSLDQAPDQPLAEPSPAQSRPTCCPAIRGPPVLL